MRKIFIVTERRADYSRFKPILELVEARASLDYVLVVTGAHLQKEQGLTINEIKKDGFRIDSTVPMFTEKGDSGAIMVRAFATVCKHLTYELEKSAPDLILSGFDIAANFAITIAGAHLNIPVAHIQGGEVSGTIDESIRHAMSKFSHYHFAANDDAVQRLIKLGERPDCIFNVGCPSIDAILKVPDIPLSNLLQKYNLQTPYSLVLQHPVTTELNDSQIQITHTLRAVTENNLNALIIYPNNDAGYSSIVHHIQNSGIEHVSTLPLGDYVNLLRHAQLLIGNSSSGIHESSTFKIPTINIGSRQSGRLRPSNVIDVDYDRAKISEAIHTCLSSPSFRARCESCSNPYGDGNSSARIVELLETLPLKHIIQKQITY
mgnify:CR=1 FL=1